MATSIIVATVGRPDVLHVLLQAVLRQTRIPAQVIVSCVTDADVGSLPTGLRTDVVCGRPGLTAQRNAGLNALSSACDVVVFFDDDFVPGPGWIAAAEDHFALFSDVVGLTGTMIADGINGPGLTCDEALSLIEFDNGTIERAATRADYSPYGCNMAFRRSAIAAETFDERLVLYGWQEDRDFGARIAKRGKLVQIAAARGVHLGIKKSRVSGVRLGYSQVINPAYLFRKGTMTTTSALSHVGKNVLANAVRSLRPEPYIDRVGRLRGNAIGLLDLVRGRLTPERAALL